MPANFKILDLLRNVVIGREQPTIVGVYGLPRGGTNFLCAWLHYHPSIFCVSEHDLEWRQPLRRFWRKRSIFGRFGRQDKRRESVTRIVFNKVQRRADLWGPDVQHRDGTKLIFYLRNPIRIHISREAFRKQHDPSRDSWADSEPNFLALLEEFACIMGIYKQLKDRVQCLVLCHEYFCCQHGQAMEELLTFLDVADAPALDPRRFFKLDHHSNSQFAETGDSDGTTCLIDKTTGRRLKGYGTFNPMRSIDLADICSDAWKSLPDIVRMRDSAREHLGSRLVDYYDQGNYDLNLVVDAGPVGPVSSAGSSP